MVEQYRDEIAMVCHDMMKDMYKIGAVSEDEMREFEENCFVEEPAMRRRPARKSGREVFG
ncbi:MAG: hypothetical protein LBG05_09215 [Treponema sp.]|jgi:DNA-binding transcriptional regulator YiaG|nr:hypothetical protein [Treponema sp.]